MNENDVIRYAGLNKIDIIHDRSLDNVPTLVQYRFPKTKKHRILKKFKRDPLNFRNVYGQSICVIEHKVFLCTDLYNIIKKKFYETTK